MASEPRYSLTVKRRMFLSAALIATRSRLLVSAWVKTAHKNIPRFSSVRLEFHKFERNHIAISSRSLNAVPPLYYFKAGSASRRPKLS